MTGSTPPWVSPKGAALLALESLVALAAGALSYALLAPTVPVTELELAGSAAKAGEILGGRRADFLRAVDADWVLIAGYALALVFAAQLGRHVFWTAGARAAARFAGIAGVVAAAADALENLLLRHALTTEAGDGWWQAAQAAAFTKFGLLALAAPVALTAVAFALGRLVTSRRHTTEPFTDDQVVAPPPVESPPGRRPGGWPPDTPRAAPQARWDAASRLPPGRPDSALVGICASGGGIRSACVTLGALQSLHEAGELQRARYLVSVSGGGYTAGAFQLALQPEPVRHPPPDPTPPPDPNAATPADVFAPGSVEEDHVRRHGRYLADSAQEWRVALAGLARGLLLSLALITLSVVVAGLVLSLFYRWVPITPLAELRPTLRQDVVEPAFPRPPGGVLLALALTGGLALLLHVLVIVALLRSWRSRRLQRVLGGTELVARGLGGLVAVLALVGVAVPALVWVAAMVVGVLADLGGYSGPVGGGVLTVLLAYFGTLVGVLWRSRKVIGAQVGRVRGLFGGQRGGMPTAVPTGLTQRLVVQLVLVVLVFALLVVLGSVVSLADTWSWPVWAALAGGLGLAALLLDQGWLSLHPFYRERLASAFSVRRATSPDGRPVAAPYDFAGESTDLASYAARVDGFPQVIFAAAANLSGSDRTPPGRRAVSFTMAGDWVGGPDIGWVRTGALQDRTAGQVKLDLTVQAAVAISGAAFASAMGRQARAYQTFFALSSARLGAWLPNPFFLRKVLDHPREDGPDWRAPRLPRLRRLPYLFREILGSYALDDRLLFCTDGGHYENLGLVELLRHRCRLVYCIDASGDAPPLATTLSEAITLAYEELGVRVTLTDPRELVPGWPPGLDPADSLTALNARLSKAGVVVGRIEYPREVQWDGAPAGRAGLLVVAKATLPVDLPYELLSYAASNPVFPRDSTGDQWFDHGQFDAYQALGRHLGRRAVEVAALADPQPGRPAPTMGLEIDRLPAVDHTDHGAVRGKVGQ